jgi:hypothetical protein
MSRFNFKAKFNVNIFYKKDMGSKGHGFDSYRVDRGTSNEKLIATLLRRFKTCNDLFDQNFKNLKL